MSQEIKVCFHCGAEIQSSASKYCSKECSKLQSYAQYKKDWFENYEDRKHVIKKIEGETGEIELEESYISLPEEILTEALLRDEVAKNKIILEDDLVIAFDELNKVDRRKRKN